MPYWSVNASSSNFRGNSPQSRTTAADPRVPYGPRRRQNQDPNSQRRVTLYEQDVHAMSAAHFDSTVDGLLNTLVNTIYSRRPPVNYIEQMAARSAVYSALVEHL
jgi:hypothetical protein